MTPERPKDPPRPDGHVRPDHDLGDIPESRVLFNTAMEMHDAKLESLTRATGDGEVVLVFSAYLHVSTGSPGIDAGGVTSERMELRIRDGRVEGEIPAFPCRIEEGQVEIAIEPFSNLLPLPVPGGEPFEIELMAISGEEFRVTGTRAELNLLSRPVFIDLEAKA